MRTRVAAAVERALDTRQRGATEEVEKILAAAVRVLERTAPAPPRVSDIVAAAGTSNAAFYRFFAGKDDLILAVMERGVGMTADYLRQQMARHEEPADKIASWVRGALAQVGEPRRTARSRAVLGQFAATPDGQITAPMRDLLLEPLRALGAADPGRDADAVFTTVAGAIRRHTASATQPDGTEVDHLVRFCLMAVRRD
ncbi:MAG: helix-turn-helix domain-containing protein [Mycobacterium sp.]